MTRCQNIVTAQQPIEVECPHCDDSSCGECHDGYFVVDECPNRYIGPDLIADLQIATSCRDGVLPTSGGLLDQSAWWFKLTQRLKAEESRIESEKEKR